MRGGLETCERDLPPTCAEREDVPNLARPEVVVGDVQAAPNVGLKQARDG